MAFVKRKQKLSRISPYSKLNLDGHFYSLEILVAATIIKTIAPEPAIEGGGLSVTMAAMKRG